jgi:hypothetical protein
MKPKAFSYSRLIARRDKLFTALRPYIDAKLSGDVISDVCNDVMPCMPESVAKNAVFESVRVLAGTTVTWQSAKLLAWRLAGNTDGLSNGKPVVPWTHQVEDEIVPVMLEHVTPRRNKNKHGFVFHCRPLAGTPCPTVFTEFVSSQSCAAISRTLGFSAPWGPYPYSSPFEFVNLMFNAHIEVARSHTVPSFVQVTATSGMVKFNRERIEVRCRAKPCPQGYEHPCTRCWVGYDHCPYGTHPTTYIVRLCPSCKSEGFFDPNDGKLECQKCQQHAPLQPTVTDAAN